MLDDKEIWTASSGEGGRGRGFGRAGEPAGAVWGFTGAVGRQKPKDR